MHARRIHAGAQSTAHRTQASQCPQTLENRHTGLVDKCHRRPGFERRRRRGPDRVYFVLGGFKPTATADYGSALRGIVGGQTWVLEHPQYPRSGARGCTLPHSGVRSPDAAMSLSVGGVRPNVHAHTTIASAAAAASHVSVVRIEHTNPVCTPGFTVDTGRLRNWWCLVGLQL